MLVVSDTTPPSSSTFYMQHRCLLSQTPFTNVDAMFNLQPVRRGLSVSLDPDEVQ